MMMNAMPKRSLLLPNMRAFTLIEVLLILFILMYLLTIAVPAGREFWVENRTIANTNELIGGLYLARSEAIQRSERETFCESANGKTCGGIWSNGQIIITPTGQVLRQFASLPKEDKLIWNSSGGTDDKVEWLPSGFTNGQRGTFYYCAGQANVADSRTIVLLNTGRLYVSPMDADQYAKFCAGGGE